ncbi:MAG TPA: amidohydrolase family protein [Burkholderiales bacterium]|nr:amidohydrolase family protein [Burkholderiales bacterium]
MITRRQLLMSALASTLAPRLAAAKASQPATAVNFEVPPLACDCHTHIHGEMREFPMSPGRIYTPEPALPQEMAELHRALHMRRVVIVTPSVYGTDNSATLWGMTARGPDARGVAVIDDKTPQAELDAMGRAGIRGIRINLATGGKTADPAAARKRFQDAAERIKSRGWHVQMYTTLDVVSAIKDLALASPVPVVFDHFGRAQASLGVEQPGFADLVGLVRAGKAYVKISGAYRISKQAPDYADATAMARALIAANPQRILWGTDWPHPNSDPLPGYGAMDVRPYFAIDDGRLLNQLPVWAPDAATRQAILVDNPARLYGFAAT